MRFPDYPDQFSCRRIINGQCMHYLESDKANTETIVMLHGNPSWSFYYRHLFNALCDQYHCIVPDHIGMGLSDKPTNGKYNFTLQERVNDLDVLLSFLDVDKELTLIVHDWGGMIGLAYATRYPNRVKRLVISNTAGFHMLKDKPMPWQLTVSRIPAIGALLIQGLNLFCQGAVRQCVTRQPMSKAIKMAYLAPYDNWLHRLSVLRFVDDIPLDNDHVSYALVQQVDNSLEQFSKLPVLICWGLNDFVFDHDFLDEWKRRIPGAEYHEYNAGHYLLEDAGDEVIPVIQNFLKKTNKLT